MRTIEEVEARLEVVEKMIAGMAPEDDEILEFEAERSTLAWVLGAKLGN